jgi:hypothetical protein
MRLAGALLVLAGLGSGAEPPGDDAASLARGFLDAERDGRAALAAPPEVDGPGR